MTMHNIKVIGSDDATLVQYDLDPMQADLLRDIAFVVNKAGEDEHCMPSLKVWMVGDDEPFQDEFDES